MRAGRIQISTREFSVVDLPKPIPESHEVLIKVMAAGVCLSDVHLLRGAITPGFLKGDVVTMGHEVAGIVESVGEKVRNFAAGDRVIVCAGVRDKFNRITTMGFDYDGGFAEYVVAGADTLVRIPEALPFEQACIIPDAVSTPWAAITQTAAVKPKESVLLFGVGGLGLHAVQLLKIVGASPIVAVDPLLQARERALAAGADFVLDPTDSEFLAHAKELTHGAGFNVAFDFVGSGSARHQSLRLLGEGGRLVIVGLANETIVIPSDITFSFKRNQILGHYGSTTRHTIEIVQMIAANKLNLSGSISQVLPLEEAATALSHLENKVGNPIRIILKP